MAQTIRYYKEETKCMNCGRFIKNVVEVDGVQYGIKCVDGFIDHKATVNKINRSKFADLVSSQAIADKKELHSTIVQFAIDTLPDSLMNRSTADLTNWLSSKPYSNFNLGIQAILVSRTIR
jgi:hypothetical protein